MMRTEKERIGLLTKSEKDILWRLAQGHNVFEISTLRHTTVNSVRAQVKSILHKLEINSQLKAAAMWWRNREVKLTEEERNKIEWYFDSHALAHDMSYKSSGVGTIEAIMQTKAREA